MSFITHRSAIVAVLVKCAIIFDVGSTPTLRAQTPDEVRARLAYLQQQEQIILDQQNWWLSRLNDGEVLFLPATPDMHFVSAVFGAPILVDRASAWDQAQRLAVAYIAMRATNPPTAQQLMAEMEEASRRMKDAVYNTLNPFFERDLQATRDEFQRYMGLRTEQGQTPTPGPAGRAWYFRRAVVGADNTGVNFQLLDYEANESGGRVQVRGRVQNSECFETWEMSWSFGGDISRLQEGMVIPVTQNVRLVSAPCPSALPSYIDVGGSTLEHVIANQAPSDVFQGAVEEQGQRCAANGSQGFATTQASLVVRGNPGQSNAWTLFRLQIYIPGQFWVVGYLYLAGGG